MSSETVEKARALRLTRLRAQLTTRVDNPNAAIEALISELEVGDEQPALWEALHAAASRDGTEEALGAAYVKTAGSQRLSRLAPEAATAFLMHAADYFQGVRGDTATAETFLERVLKVAPSHKDAFARLERRLESADDPRRALVVYANAAAAPPIAAATLATKAMHKLVLLKADSPLAEDACKSLVVLAQDNPRLLPALEAHCKLTKRSALAAACIEIALENPTLTNEDALVLRRRLLDLYLGDAGLPQNAIVHVEALLTADATDTGARKVAEKLLSVRDVASRAASALTLARRNSQPPGPRSNPPGSPSRPPPARSGFPPSASQPPGPPRSVPPPSLSSTPRSVPPLPPTLRSAPPQVPPPPATATIPDIEPDDE